MEQHLAALRDKLTHYVNQFNRQDTELYGDKGFDDFLVSLMRAELENDKVQ